MTIKAALKEGPPDINLPQSVGPLTNSKEIWQNPKLPRHTIVFCGQNHGFGGLLASKTQENGRLVSLDVHFTCTGRRETKDMEFEIPLEDKTKATIVYSVESS